MQELVSNVLTAPLGTIFVLAGVVFLFVGVVGKISGKIETGPKARLLSGVLGSAFITIGLILYWLSFPGTHTASRDDATSIETARRAGSDNPPSQPPEPIPTSSAPGDLPGWVPVYPAGPIENLSMQMLKEGKTGSFWFKCANPYIGGAALKFYEANLDKKMAGK